MYRQSVAPDLFLGAYDQERLIGFICSTLSKSESLTHESMATHNPEGKTICIHSVCVDPGHQRQKVGSSLLEEYVRRWKNGPYDGISLIAHEELTGFYVAAGFQLIGKSEVVHGSKPWFELRYSLHPPIPDAATQRRILEVLQEQSGQSEAHRLEKKLLSYFQGGPSELADESGLNKLRIYCPRIVCRSVVLLTRTATFVERSSVTVTASWILSPSWQYSDLPADRQSSKPSTTGSPSSPPGST